MTEREEHMRAQIGVIRRLCEDRVWAEDALRARNIKLTASVPELLNWLTETLDENAELLNWLTETLDENAGLRRAVDKALMLTHIVGANGGMTDKDHAAEAAIRRETGVGWQPDKLPKNDRP